MLPCGGIPFCMEVNPFVVTKKHRQKRAYNPRNLNVEGYIWRHSRKEVLSLLHFTWQSYVKLEKCTCSLFHFTSGYLAIGRWLLAFGFFSWLVRPTKNVGCFCWLLKLTKKVGSLWRCLVNLSIDCWLFIREKVGQQAKSQQKNLTGVAFFWLKSHLPNTFLAVWLTNKQKAKRQKPTKKPM